MNRLIPHINLAYLIQFSFFPILVSIFWTWLAFICLLLLEVFFLLLKSNQISSSVLIATSMTIVLALAVAVGSEIYYRAMRIVAVLVERLGDLPRFILPGLTIFILLGSPLFEISSLIPVKLVAIQYLVSIVLVLFVATGFTLIWPDFAGQNMVYALFAALLSVFVVRSVFVVDSNMLSLLESTIHQVLLFLFLYVNLHIRYKLDLAQGWEPAIIPPRLIKAGKLLVLLLIVLLFFASILNSHFGITIHVASRYMLGLYLFLTIRWLLLILQVTSASGKTVELIFEQMQRVTIVLFVTVCLALLSFWPLRKPETKGLAGIMQTNGRSAMHLTLIGRALDSDQDQNSLWPGNDPDDEDSCVRYDSTTHCPSGKESLLVQSSYMSDTSHGKIPIPNISNKKSLLFLSYQVSDHLHVEVVHPNLDRNFKKKEFLLPSNNLPYAFKGMFQNMNGIITQSSLEQDSIIALFASFGYRTICSSSLLTSKIKQLHLYAGCQIDLSSKAQNSRDFYKSYKSYKEDYNFVWHHQDITLTKSSEVNNQIAKDLEQWQDQGKIIVLIAQKDRLVAQLYEAIKGKPVTSNNTAHFISLSKVMIQAAGGSSHKPIYVNNIGMLINSPFTNQKNRLDNSPVFPRYTYRSIGNRLIFYDAITGAQLEKSK